MKDVIKTVILVIILLAIGFIILAVRDNVKKGVELLSRDNLEFNDPTIQVLYPRIENNTLLRKADLDTSSLTSEEIIDYVFDNLTSDDYKVKKYEAEKIYCRISDTIEFTTEKDSCSVIEIKNSVFTDYEKEVFNIDNELEFNELNYKGYYCKNDGKKYYCLYSKYTDSVIGYSVFKEAYEDKDGVYIYEYYLNIDLTDKDRCTHYFGESYCNNYTNLDKPTLDEETIKSDGVLYEHQFVKVDEDYYLKRSKIVSD